MSSDAAARLLKEWETAPHQDLPSAVLPSDLTVLRYTAVARAIAWVVYVQHHRTADGRATGPHTTAVRCAAEMALTDYITALGVQLGTPAAREIDNEIVHTALDALTPAVAA